MANEVEVVVSDKFVSRGGFGAAKAGMKDLDSESKKLSKSLDGLADDMGKSGQRGGSSLSSGFMDGIQGIKPAFTSSMAELGPAALALAAPAGAIAAGGIVTAFGAGIAGVGLAFAKESQVVKDELDRLKSDLGSQMKEIAKPLEQVWVNVGHDARDAFAEIKPALREAFSDMGPDLSRFSDNLFKGFANLGKSIGPLQDAFSAVLNDIGPRLPKIFDDISDSLDDLADSVKENPQALGDMVSAIGDVAEAAIWLTARANDTWSAMSKLMGLSTYGEEAAAKALALVAEQTEAAGEAGRKTTPAMREVQAALEGIADAAGDAESQASDLKTLMDNITGQTPTYTEGLKAGADAVRDMAGAFDTAEEQANGFGSSLLNQQGAFDVTVENGGKLYDQVQDVASSFDTMAAAVANGQGTREQFIADASRMRDGLNETWRQAGLTEEQIAHLNQVYGLTPDMIETRVNLLGADSAEAQMNYLARTRTASIYIQTLGGGSVNGQATFHDIYAHGGVTSTAHAATGGQRGGDIVMNERAAMVGGEAVRLPNGSTVMPAGATRALENRWAEGSGGGGGLTLEVMPGSVSGLDAIFVSWLKNAVRIRGGDPRVFGP